MTARIEEVHLALGSWSLDLNPSPEIEKYLLYYNFVRFYWDERLIYTGVLLDRKPSGAGYSVGGRHIEWLLGDGNKGPTTVRKEWLAGENKIPDPGFERGEAYWRLSENTKWTIQNDPLLARTGSGFAELVGPTVGDDLLVVEREIQVEPGQLWYAAMWARRKTPGTKGGLYFYITYQGFFETPNMIENGDFELGDEGWEIPSDVSVVVDSSNSFNGNRAVKIEPIPRAQLVPNPNFNTDLSNWIVVAGNWYHDTGTSVGDVGASVTTDTLVNNAPTKAIQADLDPSGPAAWAPVLPGERYYLQASIQGHGGADGEAQLVLVLIGDGTPATDIWHQTKRVGADGVVVGSWQQITEELDIPPGKVGIALFFVVHNHTAGFWSMDEVTLTKIKGNRRQINSLQRLTLLSGRRYHFTADVKFTFAATGSIKLGVTMYGVGIPQIFLESAVMEPLGGEWKRIVLDISPPSGYLFHNLALVASDVEGSPVYIDNIELREADNKTKMDGMVWDPSVSNWQQQTLGFAIPKGAATARLAIAAEEGADEWLVDGVQINRVIDTPAKVNEIVQELLVDPVYGNSILTPAPSSVAVLKWDWLVENQVVKDSFIHLCKSGIATGELEWLTSHDGQFSINSPESLFVDRSKSFVIRPRDLDVVELGGPEGSVEDAASEIHLIGADQHRVDGRTYKLVAKAIGAGGPRNLFGQPVSRTKLVVESSASHPDYAEELADFFLGLESQQTRGMRFRLSDWRTRGNFNPGDWLGVNQPEAEQEGDVGLIWHGEHLWPEKVRVQARSLDMAKGAFRCEIVNAAGDGRTIEIPEEAIKWSDSTVSEVEVGELIPEFAVDPEGHEAYKQFLDFRRRTQ